MAIAMASTPAIPEGKRFAVSPSLGVFEGEQAASFTGQARLSDNIYLRAGVGYGFSESTLGGGVGLTFAW